MTVVYISAQIYSGRNSGLSACIYSHVIISINNHRIITLMAVGCHFRRPLVWSSGLRVVNKNGAAIGAREADSVLNFDWPADGADGSAY